MLYLSKFHFPQTIIAREMIFCSNNYFSELWIWYFWKRFFAISSPSKSFCVGGQTLFFAKLSVLVFMLYQTMITGPDDDIDFVRMRNPPGKNYRCFRATLKQVFFSFLKAFNLCNPMTTRKFCAMNKNLLQKYKKWEYQTKYSVGILVY